jgi:hypothetical protein
VTDKTIEKLTPVAASAAAAAIDAAEQEHSPIPPLLLHPSSLDFSIPYGTTASSARIVPVRYWPLERCVGGGQRNQIRRHGFHPFAAERGEPRSAEMGCIFLPLLCRQVAGGCRGGGSMLVATRPIRAEGMGLGKPVLLTTTGTEALHTESGPPLPMQA